MSRNYQIATEFIFVDKASKALETLGIKSKFLRDTLGPGLGKAEARLGAIGSAAGKAAVGIAGISVAAIGGGIAKATGSYIAFEDAITAAGAKFQDLDVTSDTYKQDLEALQKAALDVAGATRYTANDTAGALDKMAMAGLTAKQSMALLGGTANLAAATGKDLTSAVDMATDALGAFNLTKDKFGKPLDAAGMAASLQRISDVVAKTTNKANLDMDMWFETVKMGAPTFTSLGGQIEEFSAMAGILANSGLKGSQAGNEIKNMMLNLTAPAKAGATALETLGIKVFDSSGQMRSFTDILGQFETALSGVADEKKAVLLKHIFGKEQIGAFNVLLASGSGELRNFADELYNAGGASQNMANAMNDSLKGRIELLKSALDTLGINFVKNFDSEGTRGIIDGMTQAVGYFEKNVVPRLADTITSVLPAIKNGIQTAVGALPQLFNVFANAFTVMKPLIEVLGFLLGIVWALRGPLSIVLGLWASWQVAMMALVPILHAAAFIMNTIKVVQGVMTGIQLARNAATWGTVVAVQAENAATLGAAIGMKLYSVGAGIVTAAQWLWNTALMACPIAWIIGLIVVLVGVIVVLVGKWQAVTAAVDGFFEGISNMEGVGGAILNFLVTPLKYVWSIARGLFDTIDAFIHGGFVAGIKMLGLSILQFIFTPIQAILDMISLIPGIDIGNKARAWFAETRAGILKPKSETGADAVTDSRKDAVVAQGVEPVNQRTVSETYNENSSVVHLTLDERLKASSEGSVAPNVTISRGVR